MADNNEIKAINKTGFAQRLREYKRKPLSLVLFILVVLAAAISVLALVFLIVYILVMGVPHITPELLHGNITVIMYPVCLQLSILLW